MTLDELLEAYQAANRDWDTVLLVDPDKFIEGIEFKTLQHFKELGPKTSKAYRAAKLYVIARDQGINAALMWKLSQP